MLKQYVFCLKLCISMWFIGMIDNFEILIVKGLVFNFCKQWFICVQFITM